VSRNHPRWSSSRVRGLVAVSSLLAILLAGMHSALAFHDPIGFASAELSEANEAVSHLLVSEVMTGGVSASDEFIELYNPTAGSLPLEGLEIVYVTASGGTITRKASWAAGAAGLNAGAHLLLANAAGIFAYAADITYAGGLAATGGSVAIRVLAATTAVDAVGWGDAASSWLEGAPAPGVAAGHSIERLPGGAGGSGQDTDQNSVDFVDRASPDPQGTTDDPIETSPPSGSPSATSTPTPELTATPPEATPSATETPSPSPVPTPSATPSATPSPTMSGTPTPSPSGSSSAQEPISIAEARALPDGTAVFVEGTALTDNGFSDGGGYVADATAGIAILLADGTFAHGDVVAVQGVLDDRFSQRTIRADATGLQIIGVGSDPAPTSVATASVAEGVEGQLVEIHGQVTSGATLLTSGTAYDVDDGSGPIRVLLSAEAGIDTAAWVRGATVQARGVVGQRDSSGTGTSGYRVQPRDAADILAVLLPTPSPSPTASQSASSSPSPSPNPSVISIAAARAQPANARVTVRGQVTLPTGLVDESTAAIQDASGAILLRLGDEAGALRTGELVEVFGTRSTKSGMETLRVTTAPRHLGSQAVPAARQRDTGDLGEADEAALVVVNGAVTTTPRRTSAGNVYFDVDDGSGAIRIFAMLAAEVETENLLQGTMVEVVGVLGQETTGKLPDRGYRLWPRGAQDLQVISQPAGAGPVGGSGGGSASGPGASPGPAGSVSSQTPAASGGKVKQQNRPRLVAAATGASNTVEEAPSSPTSATASPHRDGDPTPLAAGLLALGGLLLIGASVAAGRPELPGELLAWLMARLRPDAGSRGEAEADDELPAPMLPRLVPLTVAADAGFAAERTSRAVREERERILPPT
jgi:uncharacterized protein YdeI (BOF family)